MKNKQAITLLFISNIISGFAQGISMIAIPWYFIDILNQPTVFAYFYFFLTFFILFWGLYAGTIVDRYSRKKIFIYTNLNTPLKWGFTVSKYPANYIIVLNNYIPK